MQTLRKKTSPCKYRNDPGRFFGDGVSFKAKLIGILEVGEARGDRMCQEALQDLKMAIRAAGEHKQRITIHVTIDGLRLRDEKTGDSLYHHPVHKISFIAQDMTDSRAFGYIFGSPDSGHRFFGIKTDKAASQVVLAMRDLFQVVFELKKKEIELARQNIQSKTIHEHHPITLTRTVDTSSYGKSHEMSGAASKSAIRPELSPESVADLVDLEQELSSIQRGITQMERITPNEVPSKSVDSEDPFGDSFTKFPHQSYNLLPPPESSRSRHSKPLKPPTEERVEEKLSSAGQTSNEDWIAGEAEAVFEEPKAVPAADDGAEEKGFEEALITSTSTGSNLGGNDGLSKFSDAFTDLDPLGTGRTRPYVDKKFFFQDLKNPPKKVLRELSGPEVGFAATFSSLGGSGGPVDGEESRVVVAHDSGISDIDLAMFESVHPVQEKRDDVNRSGGDGGKTDDAKEIADPFAKGHIDPFMDDEDFAKVTIDPFDFSFGDRKSSFSSKTNTTTVLPDTKISAEDTKMPPQQDDEARDGVFNGPLQVSLPPESWPSYMGGPKKVDRQNSDSPTSASAIIRNRPSVFKQNTVDVISSISSKKMMKPHLFGQKFSKRDSNSINMRRLQESDSMSETETAPEPPPRPDASHVEPPPLPPKKQFGDIVIRPSSRTSGSRERYDYVLGKGTKASNAGAPPLPLPSRRVGRSDGNYPGPGRPEKKPTDDEDYLTPLPKNDMPILLPPPQAKSGTKTRGRKIETVEVRSAPVKAEKAPTEAPPVLPDITLSQLLTLGIDELATKLNVPVTKLSTMTLVELTTYLSDFLENAKKTPPLGAPQQPAPPPPAAVFKVNFDQKNDDQLFVAKFDDDENFGTQTFVANFEGVDIKPPQPILQMSSVDRYAVFREIMDTVSKDEDTPEDREEDKFEDTLERISPIATVESSPESGQEGGGGGMFPPTKIDTKITEAIAQAKDRYAALRDIILVEDLFDRAPTSATVVTSQLSDGEDQQQQQQSGELKEEEEDHEEMGEQQKNGGMPSLLDATIPAVSSSSLTGGAKDDLEIDELMNRAISNLSLDSRLSPSKSPVAATAQNASTSPIRLQQTTPILPQAKSPTLQTTAPSHQPVEHPAKTTVTDMSTSPIPIQKSPVARSPLQRSPLTKSPIDGLVMQQGSTAKSPTIPQSQGVSNILETHRQSGSLSDVVCASSPDIDRSEDAQKGKPTPVNSDSWAVFDAPSEDKEPQARSPRDPSKNGESPCSSDKDDWKGEGDFGRRWPPRGHTSSSSRDVSPWDEDTPAADYRRRPPLATDRHGHYMRHGRRMNSCDEDYEYEMEFNKKRERRPKMPMTRSRETFEGADGAWYHADPHNWSPTEDDERPRSFDRSSYERSTYGPPYEKREHKSTYPGRGYDKRKYYGGGGSYGRGDYDFEAYDDAEAYEMARGKASRKDYVDVFEAGTAAGAFERSSSRDRIKQRDYYYDRKSFDRESGESYDSGCGGRLSQREFSARDATYGSLEMMRDDYIDRTRYLSAEKTRSLRKGMRRSTEDDGYEQDSDGDMGTRRPGDTRSLQRPPQGGVPRPRKSSGSSPWDGEDLTPTGQVVKAPSVAAWKRPASASESERRLAENRRMLSHATALSGSDGEKDRRFRKKTRVRGKDVDPRVNYASLRYTRSGGRSDDYYDFDDVRAQEPEGSYYSMTKQQFFKSSTPRSETRSMGETLRGQESSERRFKKHREAYFDEVVPPVAEGKFVGQQPQKFATFDEGALKAAKGHYRREFDFEEYEDTPRSTTSSKFNFDEEQGFESDFNSPSNGKSYRFSNDFSDSKESPRPHTAGGTYSFDSGGFSTPSNTKLRFDENVQHMFEDDFSKAELSGENEDQWSAELPKKSLKVTANRGNMEHLKKSESVNIFAKKVDDPFEDDDFFAEVEKDEGKKKKKETACKWEKNFANFDDNI
ncbi:protein disabled isoform X3 [Lutzomyia longipalpis]|uniref:protein disabled isoform X3 n=1 Tax=Lutzomyia longipalpis TaxID=7200 RepID=UPI0024834EB0|nr:protein disabled isoform X3 [Lutzomyia longipalpis]